MLPSPVFAPLSQLPPSQLPLSQSAIALWLQIAIVAAWLGFVVVVAEGLNRLGWGTSELSRKVVHIGTGNVILLAWWLQTPMWVGIGASALSGAIALLSHYLPLLPSINSVGRKSLGTFFYAISVGVLIAWFWPLQQPQYAAIGILIMSWGDGLAALVGQQWGRRPYRLWGMSKSWEGSLTMTLASAIVAALILVSTQGNQWQVWLSALVVAVVATALEAFSKWGVDNLTVPVGSAAIALWLSQVW
ncbi:MAG TPA: diacylglycerol/polyprenol kinase family protein [Chroococcidiopsis sp.]